MQLVLTIGMLKLGGSSSCESGEGSGEIAGSGFENHAQTVTSLCDDTMIISVYVDYGHWVDGIRVVCADDADTIDFLVGQENDQFAEACSAVGIQSISSYIYNDIYPSRMTIECADGMTEGPFGTHYDGASLSETPSSGR